MIDILLLKVYQYGGYDVTWKRSVVVSHIVLSHMRYIIVINQIFFVLKQYPSYLNKPYAAIKLPFLVKRALFYKLLYAKVWLPQHIAVRVPLVQRL